jgi:hypothetical protein
MGLSIHRAHLRRNLAPMIPPSTTQGSDYPPSRKALFLNPGDPDLSVIRGVFPGPDSVKDLLIEGWVWREGAAIPSAEGASNQA